MPLLDRTGTYRARALSAGLGRSGSKNTPQVAVRFEIVEGECQGMEITWYGYLSDAALARTIESLEHTGWAGDDLSDLSAVGSSECSIVVAEEEYLGDIKLKVRRVNALNSGVAMANAMATDEAAEFAARMRARVAASRAARGGKGQQRQAPRQSAPTKQAHPNAPDAADGAPARTDEDVPF